MTIFDRAVTEHGDINPAYFALYWVLIVVLTAVPWVCLMGAWQMYYDEHHVYPMAAVGSAIRDIGWGFGAVVGAIGVYLWGDSRKSPTIGDGK